MLFTHSQESQGRFSYMECHDLIYCWWKKHFIYNQSLKELHQWWRVLCEIVEAFMEGSQDQRFNKSYDGCPVSQRYVSSTQVLNFNNCAWLWLWIVDQPSSSLPTYSSYWPHLIIISSPTLNKPHLAENVYHSDDDIKLLLIFFVFPSGRSLFINEIQTLQYQWKICVNLKVDCIEK